MPVWRVIMKHIISILLSIVTVFSVAFANDASEYNLYADLQMLSNKLATEITTVEVTANYKLYGIMRSYADSSTPDDYKLYADLRTLSNNVVASTRSAYIVANYKLYGIVRSYAE